MHAIDEIWAVRERCLPEKFNVTEFAENVIKGTQTKLKSGS